MVSEWYLTEWYSEWSNGILNGIHSEYHWRRSWNASYKYHSEYHWTIQNTIQSSTIQIPLAIIPLGPFKYNYNTIQLFIYTDHQSTIEVPYKKYHWPYHPLGPFKYHSNSIQLCVYRPPKYYWSTIQYHSNILGHNTPTTIQWYLNGIFGKGLSHAQ